MEQKTFQAMIVEETEDKQFVREIREKSVDDLPDGEVLIQVMYSSLNYKDALSAIGNRGVTRNYPHTPGIDASGVVAESSSDAFQPGDEVLVTGYDLGMNTSGGFGQYIRVPADWVVKLPENLTLRESMVYGTAGFTAGLSVAGLVQCGVQPDQGEILVTGATGGVGSVAVALLAKIGYEVIGATGKSDEKQFLLDLGAKDIISREEVTDTSKRPLLKGRWAGVVDTVGGDMLATALKSTKQWATVTCCGNVASPELPTTVFPFILRGINLIGIDSANCPMQPSRMKTWEHLAGDWKPDRLNDLSFDIGLNALSGHIDQILKGKLRGRAVVNMKD